MVYKVRHFLRNKKLYRALVSRVEERVLFHGSSRKLKIEWVKKGRETTWLFENLYAPLFEVPDAPAVVQIELLAQQTNSKLGSQLLIRAVQLLVEQGYSLHLVIGGTGPQRAEWEGLAKHLGMCDHVTFLGFVPDDKVAHFFASSDIFVLPAVVNDSGDTEGLGVVLLEAMANGVPVIATKVGGISDIVVDGETGLLVEQGSATQLAEKIALLCQDPALRTSIGLAAQERVRRFFSWSSIVEGTLQVYHSVLVRRG
jgi:glycosyltransferase involved in cell wall biosynthesis